MRRPSFTATMLLSASSLAAGLAEAQAPHLGYEPELAFRILLGAVDGEENTVGLRGDNPRFAVGLAASSPVALDGRLAANLEIWLTERDYDTSAVPPPLDTASRSMTFSAVAITYGLRLQPAAGRFRPYAMAGLGFQGSRLRTTGTTAGVADSAQEEIITPTAHVGVGVEWQWGRDSFGIDYRRWLTEGEFRDFGIEDAQLGGEFLGLSLGTRW